MRRKICLVIAFAFILGTMMIATPIPLVKAQEVRFYVSPTIISRKTAAFTIDVYIQSPDAWANTPSGIVGYALSLRVNPKVLEVRSARKGPTGTLTWLETFLMNYGYDLDYATSFLFGAADKVTGTIPDASEYIGGYKTLGVGAGGTGRLMQFIVYPLLPDSPSPLDITGRPVLGILEFMAIYTTPDGVDHYVDLMDDGWYLGATTDVIYLDLMNTFEPTNPVGSTWHEILPTWSNEYTLTAWLDANTNGALDVPDKVALTKDATETWWQVDWINPSPGAGDARWDLIMKSVPPPVPEFPLGLGIIMAMAPAIPVLYLWRTRKRKGE